MKIRCGFVSNSSSSSYIVRGIKMSRNELEEKLKQRGIEEGIYSWEINKKISFSIMPDSNYFENNYETSMCIVGIKHKSPEDGEIIEIKDDSELDKKIKDDFEKIGIKVDKLSTFFQYVSNDNC